MKILTLLSFFFLFAWLPFQAQETPLQPPSPPPGPLIQIRAPDFSCWTMTLKFSSSGSTQPNSPSSSSLDESKNTITKTLVTKTGTLIRVEFTDYRQQVWTTWISGDKEVAEWPDKKSVAFSAKPQNPNSVSSIYWDFSKSDFKGFDWISPANYTGIKEINGKSCLVFKTSLLSSGVSVSLFAAVELQTRLPVELEDSSGLTDYEFNTPPTAMQTLPENVNQLIVNQENKEKALARLPGPAF